MNDRAANAIQAIDQLTETANILRDQLFKSKADGGDAAHGTLTKLLMQMMGHFGPDSVASRQLFPALDQIKSRIDSGNYVGAVWDTEKLVDALLEIRKILASQA